MRILARLFEIATVLLMVATLLCMSLGATSTVTPTSEAFGDGALICGVASLLTAGAGYLCAVRAKRQKPNG
ncbi:hypothetical protein OKA05_28500 [Luteolibacter arcticus]|uniref:Uncharacterized protein n=1 Tax=Luteolibacter arcticus TaxID=1581411 RepID=A0ABT3GSL4_9BACT|nr:hypothetical protein [Luteolibacter arcticus]MCW1926526.1 hypothetical protein [Luteolibacter arcticus]